MSNDASQTPSGKPPAAHLGGEEWRDMDGSDLQYDPDKQEPFQKVCRERLREHRMREVTVRVLGPDGSPISGEPVEIRQHRHAFCFGEQLWPLDGMVRDGEGGSERARAWKRRFAEVFNASNNLCYWTERPRHDASKTEDQQGDWRLDNFSDTVDWTLSQGMLAKGHPLFWSIPKCVPDWVRAYDYATRMKFAEVRVRNLVARFKGRVKMWDAVNEPMWEATFKHINEREWPHIEAIRDIADMIEPVLTWCREEDPDALYLVNDYGMEESGEEKILKGNDGSKVTAASQRKRYVALIEELQQRNCAPDAIGLQSHTGWVAHDNQWTVYDQFAESGLPVHITEFWAHTRDLKDSGRYSPDDLEQLLATFVCNSLRTAFAHPAVEAFFFWGFMGTAISWGERSGHDLKPVFTAVRDLIHKEWNTRESLTTDAEGTVRFRGFFGDYTLRQPLGATTTTGIPFTVAREGAELITLTTRHRRR